MLPRNTKRRKEEGVIDRGYNKTERGIERNFVRKGEAAPEAPMMTVGATKLVSKRPPEKNVVSLITLHRNKDGNLRGGLIDTRNRKGLEVASVDKKRHKETRWLVDLEMRSVTRF